VTYIFRKLSSSWCSNWHVTLDRLTVFEIFAVKWLFAGPKTDLLSFFGLAFGDPYRYRHRKDRSSVWMIDLPSCKLPRRSVAPPPRYLSPDTKRDIKNYSKFNIGQNALRLSITIFTVFVSFVICYHYKTMPWKKRTQLSLWNFHDTSEWCWDHITKFARWQHSAMGAGRAMLCSAPVVNLIVIPA